MIKVEIKKEYHKNGALSYESKIGIIQPQFLEKYKSNKTLHKFRDSNNHYIILYRAKYHDNGVNAWTLEYNDNGEEINKTPNRRKDNTIITY